MNNSTRLIIVVVLSFTGITVFNHFLMKKFQADEETYQKEYMDKKVKIQAEIKKVSKAPEKVDHTPNKLVPSNPADYGIITVSNYNKPRSQVEWDAFVEKAFVESKLFESEKGKEAIEKMKTTPDKFANIMSRVDEDIKKFEKLKYEDPFNEFTLKRLEVLYKLKSLSKVLKDKVVEVPQLKGLIAETDDGQSDGFYAPGFSTKEFTSTDFSSQVDF